MPTSEKDYGDAQLAAAIVELRKTSGLSMDAFAAKLGVSQPTQSRIERAKRLPDALYLRALRTHFQIDINTLLEGGISNAAAPSTNGLPADYHASAPEHKSHSIKKTPGRTSAPASEPAKGRKRAA